MIVQECPLCHKQNPPDIAVCIHCGRRMDKSGTPAKLVSAAKTCPSCRSEVHPEAKICPQCRHRFGGGFGWHIGGFTAGLGLLLLVAGVLVAPNLMLPGVGLLLVGLALRYF